MQAAVLHFHAVFIVRRCIEKGCSSVRQEADIKFKQTINLMTGVSCILHVFALLENDVMPAMGNGEHVYVSDL